jgi:hypothetical protein
MARLTARFRPYLAVFVVAAITATSGRIAGSFSHRWGKPFDLSVAAEHLAATPENCGDWELQTSRPLDADSVEMLQCAGSTQRTYRNRTTGQIVSMFMIVGPPGPTAVHAPEICYSSQAYDSVEPRKRIQVRGSQFPDEAFWETVFRHNDLYAHVLCVAYAWNAGDGWRAAERPRFSFANRPLLYKLQVAGNVRSADSRGEDDPCVSFLRDFLPVLDAALFQSAGDE